MPHRANKGKTSEATDAFLLLQEEIHTGIYPPVPRKMFQSIIRNLEGIRLEHCVGIYLQDGRKVEEHPLSNQAGS